MRRLALLCCVAAIAACAKTEKPADTTAAAATTPPPPPPAPAPIALADVAGKWNVKSMNAANDSVLIEYVLDAKADTTGWTMTFPKGKPIPMHVRPDADSIIIDAGPYPSALRKGVNVTIHGSSRLKDGKLVGTSVAHYAVKTADSVITIKTEGTKAP
jgi:hypothetical protein